MKKIATALLFATLASGTARAEDLAIVVAPSVPLSNLTLAEALRLFQGKTKNLSEGLALKLVTRERGAPERATLLAGLYNFTDAEFEKYFFQAVFIGALPAVPRLVPSALAMKKLTLANPGTLGYLRASDVDATVKVVKLDGLTPGDPNYRLKLPAN